MRFSRRVGLAFCRCARAASNSPRPISTSARMVSSQYGKLEVMPRSAVPLSLSASSQSPTANSASIWFATSKVLLIPYRRITLSPACPSRADSLSRPQHCQRIGEVGVRAGQAEVIADFLGELQGPAEVGGTLLAAAKVDEVAAEHGERPYLCLACAELPGQRERLLADRQRLRMAPGHHHPSRE